MSGSKNDVYARRRGGSQTEATTPVAREATKCSREYAFEYVAGAAQLVVATPHPYKGAGGYISATSTPSHPVAELASLPETPSNEERDRALPPGLKASYCPTCNGRTVVIAPAAANLMCAGCAPAWQVPRRRSHNQREDTR